MVSGNDDDFAPWPDMKADRLLDMYPESELVKIYAMPQHSAQRTTAWEALGVVDPVKQAACEVELDALINKLAKKNTELPKAKIERPDLSSLSFDFFGFTPES